MPADRWRMSAWRPQAPATFLRTISDPFGLGVSNPNLPGLSTMLTHRVKNPPLARFHSSVRFYLLQTTRQSFMFAFMFRHDFLPHQIPRKEASASNPHSRSQTYSRSGFGRPRSLNTLPLLSVTVQPVFRLRGGFPRRVSYTVSCSFFCSHASQMVTIHPLPTCLPGSPHVSQVFRLFASAASMAANMSSVAEPM